MLTGIIGDKEEKCVGKGGHKDEPKTEKVSIARNAFSYISILSKSLQLADISESVNVLRFIVDSSISIMLLTLVSWSRNTPTSRSHEQKRFLLSIRSWGGNNMEKWFECFFLCSVVQCK